MLHFTRPFSLFISAWLLLLTSCGTFLKGTTESVSFRSNVPSAVFVVDDSIRVRNGSDTLLASRQDHRVRVDARGYEPVEFSVHKKLHPSIIFNAFVLPLVTGSGIFLVSNREVNNQGQYDFIAVPLIYGGMFLTAAAFGMDAFLGGGYQLPNSYEIELYQVPERLHGDLPRIDITEVEVLARGTKVGRHHNRLGLGREDYVLQPGKYKRDFPLYLLDDEVKAQVNDVLHDLGCNVPEDLSNELGQEDARYSLAIELSGIKLNSHRRDGSYKTDGELTVEWKLFSINNGEEVYSKVFTTSGTVETRGGPNALFLALKRNVHALVDDGDFRSLMMPQASKETEDR